MYLLPMRWSSCSRRELKYPSLAFDRIENPSEGKRQREGFIWVGRLVWASQIMKSGEKGKGSKDVHIA